MKSSLNLVLGVLFFCFFVFVVVFQSSVGGMVSHTIISPFGTNVTAPHTDGTYNSQRIKGAGDPPTEISDSFRDIDEYKDTYSLGEPFCLIGGQYTIYVSNDARPVPASKSEPLPVIYNETFKLYYCKTVLDVLERVNIPVDWGNDDLVVYCNDGSMINNNNSNYDFITAEKINSYKICVVRNLDRFENNVIMYGFEVGNKVVDNFGEYYYDNVTHKSPILVGLEFIEVKDEYLVDGTMYNGEYVVPYKEKTETIEQGDEYIIEKKYVPRTMVEARNYLDSKFQLVPGYIIEHVQDVEENSESESYSVWDMWVPISYIVGEYIFNDTDDKQYIFRYDYYNKFYSLADYPYNLNLAIEDIFPDMDVINISRVALFRKFGSDLIYGYEEAARNSIDVSAFMNSIKPVYKIDFSSVNGYSQSDCMDILSKYQTANGFFDIIYGINCDGDEIDIVSDVIDANENSGVYSFNLFKNIIMGYSY